MLAPVQTCIAEHVLSKTLSTKRSCAIHTRARKVTQVLAPGVGTSDRHPLSAVPSTVKSEASAPSLLSLFLSLSPSDGERRPPQTPLGGEVENSSGRLRDSKGVACGEGFERLCLFLSTSTLPEHALRKRSCAIHGKLKSLEVFAPSLLSLFLSLSITR